jgi:Kef-type K+ transport system membrane component KefB
MIAGYSLLLAGTVGLFLLIRAHGETLEGPTPATAAGERPAARPETLLHVLVALLTIIVLGRLLGKAFAWIGQPPVIGEVVAGILLGPSFLGRVAPGTMAFLLPANNLPYLGVLAQLGAILYMFVVGLELNAGLLRARAHALVAISNASIVAPFLLGAALALPLYPRLAPAGVPFTSFALFMAVALSITAFPVLARILTDRRLDKTELGVVALGCAAANDVTAWCLLAFVIGVAQAQVAGALTTVVLAVAFLLVMFLVVRPVGGRLLAAYHHVEDLPPRVVAGVLVALLVCSVATEAIGIHAVFGAFLLGAVIPHDSSVARVFTRKLEDIIGVVLLPAFFAYTGMRTEIGLVAGWEEWLICGGITAAAIVGKFGGTLVAARCTGLGWRTSAAMGMLMNTRGLMELIVLNIGLDLGVISPTLFAMMVLMALVTTMTTTPVLQWLGGGGDKVLQ